MISLCLPTQGTHVVSNHTDDHRQQRAEIREREEAGPTADTPRDSVGGGAGGETVPMSGLSQGQLRRGPRDLPGDEGRALVVLKMEKRLGA